MRRFAFVRVFAVLAKEFTQLTRERVTYAMILVLPVIQLMLFGFAINNDPHHLPAAVFVQDHSNLTRALVASMERTEYVDVRYLPRSEGEMERLMRRGKIMLAVTIPPDFTRDVLRGETPAILAEADATDPVAAGGALAAVSALPAVALRRDLTGAATQEPPAAPPFEVVVHRRYNPENLTSRNVLPGLLGIILSMTLVMMTAMAVTREYERGTMETLLSTPVTSAEIMIGKLTPYVLVGMLQTCVVVTVAHLLFDMPLAGSAAGWLAFVLAVLLFILGNLSLGYLISTLAKSQLQAMQMSVFYILPSIFLSGFIFPFLGMPRWAQAIGEAVPVTHFLRLVRGSLLKDQILADMSGELLALALIVLIFAGAAIARSRTTLD
jgi:ABC-2 type transport system permease protein